MCCYTLIVTFTILESGISRVSLNNEIGFEIPGQYVKAYVEIIDTLLFNDNLCKQFAEVGHKRVKKITIS